MRLFRMCEDRDRSLAQGRDRGHGVNFTVRILKSRVMSMFHYGSAKHWTVSEQLLDYLD